MQGGTYSAVILKKADKNRKVNMSKTALVTGSSRGIGKACALKLAELGYDIAVNCNSNLEMAQKAVDEITDSAEKPLPTRQTRQILTK